VRPDIVGVAPSTAVEPERTAPVVEVRGPVPAPIERLRSRTRWQVWLRSADRHALRRVARGMMFAIDHAPPSANISSALRVSLDVDPMSAL
jgi:primosomal protein N'